jgi:cytochrome c-type biogenesis protein CcmH
MSATRKRLPPPRRSLFMVLAAIAIIASVWSWLYFAAPQQQTLDQHERSIASQLRCPVCQGESVADATPLIAQQMRAYIRQQIQAGKSDQEIIQFLTSRYGSEIDWVPQWQGFTLLAWVVPIVLMLAGVFFLYFVARDWHTSAASMRLATARSEGDSSGDTHISTTEDADLERYRAQLEQELAADDPLFKRFITEAD